MRRETHPRSQISAAGSRMRIRAGINNESHSVIIPIASEVRTFIILVGVNNQKILLLETMLILYYTAFFLSIVLLSR